MGKAEQHFKNSEGAAAHIRPARREDTPRISMLLAEAFPALYVWTFGKLTTRQITELLAALYDAGTLGISTIRLAEHEGFVIGLVILNIGEPIGKGALRDYWRVVRAQLGILKGLRAFAGGTFANAMINRRIPKGEDMTYIEAFAVDAEARGGGIGTRLLQDATAWSLARGRRRMALHVLQSNMGARRLYERMGFRLPRPEPPPMLSSRRVHWVSLLMLRDLS